MRNHIKYLVLALLLLGCKNYKSLTTQIESLSKLLKQNFPLYYSTDRGLDFYTYANFE